MRRAHADRCAACARPTGRAGTAPARLPVPPARPRRKKSAGASQASQPRRPVDAGGGREMHAHLVPHAGQAVAEGMDRARRIGAEVAGGDEDHARSAEREQARRHRRPRRRPPRPRHCRRRRPRPEPGPCPSARRLRRAACRSARCLRAGAACDRGSARSRPACCPTSRARRHRARACPALSDMSEALSPVIRRRT